MTTKNERALAKENYRYKLEGHESTTDESSAVEFERIKVRSVIEHNLAEQMDKPVRKKPWSKLEPDVSPVQYLDENEFGENRILARLKPMTKKKVGDKRSTEYLFRQNGGREALKVTDEERDSVTRRRK